MVLLFAAAAVLAAEDGHDHGSSASEGACAKAYEWGGIFETPTASKVYTWTAYKTGTPAAFAEAHMKVVFLPVADAAEATLTAAKAEAIDGMGHTPCTDVEPGDTIVPAGHKCSIYVGNRRSGASASSPSSTPRQRQNKLRAASSLGQPEPIGRMQTRSGWSATTGPRFPHAQVLDAPLRRRRGLGVVQYLDGRADRRSPGHLHRARSLRV